MHLLRTPAQAGLKLSLPCVKRAGTYPKGFHSLALRNRISIKSNITLHRARCCFFVFRFWFGLKCIEAIIYSPISGKVERIFVFLHFGESEVVVSYYLEVDSDILKDYNIYVKVFFLAERRRKWQK